MLDGAQAPRRRVEATEVAVRELVERGKIGPGEWLREVPLAHSIGVSRTPVREALLRLAREGVIEHVERRGFRIPELDPVELGHVYPVLMALEELAVRASSTDGFAALADQLDAMNFAVVEGPDAAYTYATQDHAWHRTLVASAGNPVLLEHFDQVYAKLLHYIRFYWATHDVDESRAEHAAIARAIRKENPRLALALLLTHRQDGLVQIKRLMLE